MNGIPDAIFVIDTGNEAIAVHEAKVLGIPVIGVVDSNNSPDDIDYIVPGNDDAIRSVKLYIEAVADAIIEGKAASLNLGSADAVQEDAPKPAPKKKTAKKLPKVNKPPKVVTEAPPPPAPVEPEDPGPTPPNDDPDDPGF